MKEDEEDEKNLIKWMCIKPIKGGEVRECMVYFYTKDVNGKTKVAMRMQRVNGKYYDYDVSRTKVLGHNNKYLKAFENKLRSVNGVPIGHRWEQTAKKERIRKIIRLLPDAFGENKFRMIYRYQIKQEDGSWKDGRASGKILNKMHPDETINFIAKLSFEGLKQHTISKLMNVSQPYTCKIVQEYNPKLNVDDIDWM